MKTTHSRRAQRGFSLLETLVAFSIMALALGVLLRIFGGGAQLTSLSEENARAVLLAESLLAAAGVDQPLLPGETSGEIDDDYSWRLIVQPYVPEGEPLPEQLPFKPYWVELTVLWGEGDAPHEFTLSTMRLLSEAELRKNLGPGHGFGP